MRLAPSHFNSPQRIRFALLTAALMATCSSIARAEIAWRADLTSAHAEATAQNKPILLHFYSDNCVWCDRLEAGAFQSAEVNKAIAGGFVPIKIHAGQSPELAKMFKVTKFPTDVVVTPTGQTLAHGVSPQDPKGYVTMLAKANNMMAAATPPMGPAMGPPENPTTGLPDPTMVAARSNANSTQPPSVAPPSQTVSAANAQAYKDATVNPMAYPPPAQTAAARPATATLPGGATARLAGVRTDGMSLGLPGQMTNDRVTNAPPANVPTADDVADSQDRESDSTPKLAMEGFCAVTVIDEDKWVEGNPKFGVVHLGKLYLFSSAEKMETFLADPMPYTPVLNEIDVVRFFEERQIVAGKRRFGMRDPVHQRMFFFADEAAMNHFFNDYDRYTDAAIEVMARAVKDSNQGVH